MKSQAVHGKGRSRSRAWSSFATTLAFSNCDTAPADLINSKARSDSIL
jgi:hypothetical protein